MCPQIGLIQPGLTAPSLWPHDLQLYKYMLGWVQQGRCARARVVVFLRVGLNVTGFLTRPDKQVISSTWNRVTNGFDKRNRLGRPTQRHSSWYQCSGTEQMSIRWACCWSQVPKFLWCNILSVQERKNLTMLRDVQSIHRSLLSQAGLAQYLCRTNPHVLRYNFYVAHTPYGAQEVSLFTSSSLLSLRFQKKKPFVSAVTSWKILEPGWQPAGILWPGWFWIPLGLS